MATDDTTMLRHLLTPIYDERAFVREVCELRTTRIELSDSLASVAQYPSLRAAVERELAVVDERLAKMEARAKAEIDRRARLERERQQRQG